MAGIFLFCKGFFIMKTYAEKLKDPRWQKKRLKVLERDNFKCQACSYDDKTLHVHHTIYKGNPWDVEDHNLITLCEDCHKITTELDKLSKIYGGESVYSVAKTLFEFEFYSINKSFEKKGEEAPFIDIPYPFF